MNIEDHQNGYRRSMLQEPVHYVPHIDAAWEWDFMCSRWGSNHSGIHSSSENCIPGKINCLYHVLSTVNKVATKWSFTCHPDPLPFLPWHALVTSLKLYWGLQFVLTNLVLFSVVGFRDFCLDKFRQFPIVSLIFLKFQEKSSIFLRSQNWIKGKKRADSFLFIWKIG